MYIISQAFQVFCRVPSSCEFVSDHEVVCGGEDGVLLTWDIRNPRSVGLSPSGSAAVKVSSHSSLQ